MRLNLVTLAIMFVGVVWACLHASSVAWDGVKIAGAAIAVVALTLVVVARAQLGASFSVQAKARKLVTTGLYSRIRNPIYLFAEFFIVGMAMVLGRWEFLALAVAMIPVQVFRARKEARVLSEAFGEEYARYKAKTWF
ncbi:MAG: isoprenylcysteine carboxylmethyltransferase family protein [Acidobacteriaceae bacterium]|nr:isoprenylcysteine carboxylmethyltransferase family protein [Acidobacteriaceae bacterium]